MADNNDLLVITAAGGIQCSYLIPLLYEKHSLRLVVNSTASVDRLKQQYPNADVVQADISEPSQCKSILEGATRLYHVGPSLHPHELEIGLFMVDAALHENQRTGGKFKHFIFSSVLNTQIRKMYNHDRKRYVEEYLFESGLNYTVLNPCDFLNMAFPVKVFAGMDKPEYKSLKGLNSKSSFLVLEDYAEACVKVIEEGEKHYCAQYQMCSMMPISYGDAARDLGVVLGKDFPVSQKPLQDAMDSLSMALFGRTEGVNQVAKDGVERLELYYRSRGLQGSPNVMRWLLGREPTSHKEWFEKEMKEVRENGAIKREGPFPYS